MLSKSAEAAIAAMGRLAQAQCRGEPPLTAVQVAEDRGLQRPYAAKLLTVLSQHGLVIGTPGPNGGYRLARAAAEISLLQIVACFERPNLSSPCMFHPEHCGGDYPPCPLHHGLERLRSERDTFLRETTLADFCV